MERGRTTLGTPEVNTYGNILEEAEELVYGPRQEAYGHPFDDFSRTAKIWEAIFGHPVTPNQVALCLVGVKISREVNHPKRDNRVDGAGYFAALDRVVKHQEEMYRVGWPGD